MTRQLIRAAGSLSELAKRYQLAGWQGLYFAEVNAAFRQQFPNPWGIPDHIEIGIPGSSFEQLTALSLRIAQLQAVERQVERLADKQRRLLLSPFGNTEPSEPRLVICGVVKSVVSTTGEAIGLLKSPDWRAPHKDLELLGDALARSTSPDLRNAALLFSLLARAAQAVPWCVPAVSAEAWCDPRCPHFWAKPLLLSNLPITYADPAAQRASVSALLRAQQLAVEHVIRQLRSLRTEAVMESNHLARLSDASI